jgi:hypothetical protein
LRWNRRERRNRREGKRREEERRPFEQKVTKVGLGWGWLVDVGERSPASIICSGTLGNESVDRRETEGASTGEWFFVPEGQHDSSQARVFV